MWSTDIPLHNPTVQHAATRASTWLSLSHDDNTPHPFLAVSYSWYSAPVELPPAFHEVQLNYVVSDPVFIAGCVHYTHCQLFDCYCPDLKQCSYICATARPRPGPEKCSLLFVLVFPTRYLQTPTATQFVFYKFIPGTLLRVKCVCAEVCVPDSNRTGDDVLRAANQC